MTRTFYDLLGVDPDADRAELMRGYRERARRHHPDVSDDPDAADRFARVNRAREVLTDPRKRARYDELGHAHYLRRTGELDLAVATGVTEAPGGATAGGDAETAGDGPESAGGETETAEGGASAAGSDESAEVDAAARGADDAAGGRGDGQYARFAGDAPVDRVETAAGDSSAGDRTTAGEDSRTGEEPTGTSGGAAALYPAARRESTDWARAAVHAADDVAAVATVGLVGAVGVGVAQLYHSAVPPNVGGAPGGTVALLCAWTGVAFVAAAVADGRARRRPLAVPGGLLALGALAAVVPVGPASAGPVIAAAGALLALFRSTAHAAARGVFLPAALWYVGTVPVAFGVYVGTVRPGPVARAVRATTAAAVAGGPLEAAVATPGALAVAAPLAASLLYVGARRLGGRRAGLRVPPTA